MIQLNSQVELGNKALIYNSLGQIVHSFKLTQSRQTENLANLIKGKYYLVYPNSSKTISQGFMVY